MATKTAPAIPDYKKCKIDEIIAYCQAVNEVAWLKETNEASKNFFQLRKAFFTKFAPEAIPTKAKKTYKDKIAAL